MTVSLVFPSGSSKCVTTAYCVDALDKEIQQISSQRLVDHTTCITAGSGGAYAAAWTALGKEPSELAGLFAPGSALCNLVATRQFNPWMVESRPRLPLFADSLFGNGPERAAKALFAEHTFADAKCTLRIAASTDHNRPVTINSGSVSDALAATSAIRKVFDPAIVQVGHLEQKPIGYDNNCLRLWDASFSDQYLPAISAANYVTSLGKRPIVTIYFDHTPNVPPDCSWSESYSTLTWTLSADTKRLEGRKIAVIASANTRLGPSAKSYHLQVPYPVSGVSPIDFSPQTMTMLHKASDDYLKENKALIKEVAEQIVRTTSPEDKS